MANADSSAGGRVPGRRWYVVAAVIALAGWTAMALLLVSRIGDSTGRMMRVLVPGQTDLMLKEPGTYTIFHEYQSTFEGRVYDVATVSGLIVTVRAGGAVIPLVATKAGTRYRVGSLAGRSLFDFEVRTPGTYQISASYDGGRKEPQTVLAIDRGFVGDLVMTILGALALALGGMGIAVAISVVVFLKRRRALGAAAS
ncbi:MAG: hypothetical protein K2Y71_15685 [Xanthobacteraceae bacterium]|nr:hypothetical protein [Xanthobacteraceae bacterium]